MRTSLFGNDPSIILLSIEPEGDEVVCPGDEIDVPLLDGSRVTRSVEWIMPRFVSYKRIEISKIMVGMNGEIAVRAVEPNDVASAENIYRATHPRPSRVCITPYKELMFGDESIYDFVDPSFSMPDKVIKYLQTTEPWVMSPGIYDHPFKKGVRLLGPYISADDVYCWDSNTWKYVVKYHLTLPQDFIDHVLSDKGTLFLERATKRNGSWHDRINELAGDGPQLDLLPADDDDISLDEF